MDKLTSNEILPTQAKRMLYLFRNQPGKFRSTMNDTIYKWKENSSGVFWFLFCNLATYFFCWITLQELTIFRSTIEKRLIQQVTMFQ